MKKFLNRRDASAVAKAMADKENAEKNSRHPGQASISAAIRDPWFGKAARWIPAFAGMTVFLLFFSSPSFAAEKETAYERVAKTGTIRCGYSPWPPFVVKDPNSGAMSGILVDVLAEIGKSLDFKIDWSYETGYGNYAEDLNTGRFDVMCATLWADGPRIKNSLLIDPFLYSGVYLVVRAGDKRFDKDYTVLNDGSLAVSGTDGDITATLANRLFPKARKVFLPNTATPAEMAENVKTGKTNAMFSDAGFFNEYDQKNPGVLKILKQNPAWVFGERMAVKKGETELKYILDTAISEVINSGKIEEIIKKYPGVSTWAPDKNY